jgi:FHS family L-fucose permease-like MFS transporter
MGAVGDHYGMSRAFIVPLCCFGFVAFYGFSWARLAKSEGSINVSTTRGH